jgi:hypothetical protein
MANEQKKLKDLDEKTNKLIGHYVKTYEYLLKLLVSKIEKGLSHRHIDSIIREIQSILKGLDDKAYKYCTETLVEYYIRGMDSVDEQIILMELALTESGMVLHKKAIEKAISDTYADLAARTRFMEEEAKKIIREIASELINRQMITGESRKQVVKELQQKLEANGIACFIDRAGRKWSISRYADMLLRTKSRILHTEGTYDRLKDYQKKYPDNADQFDLIQVSRHGSTDWCGKFEGCVFSISGTSNIYPPVSSLPNGYSVLHPNCTHVFVPYIPALRGKGQICDPQYLNRTVSELNKQFYHSTKK